MSEKLIRALARGGCACWRDGAWVVLRGGDRRGRAIGTLSGAQVVALMDAGDLEEAREGVLKWIGAAPTVPAKIAKTPDFTAAAPRRSALESVLDSIGNSQDRALARAAAHRFLSDVEQAASGQRITQNWDPGLHVDGLRGRGAEGGRGVAAVQASRRLAQLAGALASGDIKLLTSLIVEQRSLAELARRSGVATSHIRGHLAAVIERLEKAYRLRVAAPR
ncbi:MAG: DUF6456 domain-containing protein [Pseudomonadota bacterium]